MCTAMHAGRMCTSSPEASGAAVFQIPELGNEMLRLRHSVRVCTLYTLRPIYIAAYIHCGLYTPRPTYHLYGSLYTLQPIHTAACIHHGLYIIYAPITPIFTTAYIRCCVCMPASKQIDRSPVFSSFEAVDLHPAGLNLHARAHKQSREGGFHG